MTYNMMKFGLECTVEADFYYIPDKKTMYLFFFFLTRWNEEKCCGFIVFFYLEGDILEPKQPHPAKLLDLFTVKYLEACNPALCCLN